MDQWVLLFRKRVLILTDLIFDINKVINKIGEDNPNYESLSLIEFNRKIIKTSIRTKVYNVSLDLYKIEYKLERKEDLTIEQITNNLIKTLKKRRN